MHSNAPQSVADKVQVMWGVEIAVMLSMIAMNSIFAGYEIALASASVARLQVLVRERRSGADAALHMKTNMEGSLAVVQLGITLFGAIAAATGGAGAGQTLEPWLRERLGVTAGVAEVLAIALVVVPLTIVTIVFGELIPKVFALRNKEWLCLKLSPAMCWFSFGVWPAVWLFEVVVKGLMNWGERRWQPRLKGAGRTEADELSELRAMAGLARTLRLIGTREENIILGAAGLSNRPVRDIMSPASHINMLNVNDSLADSLVAAHLNMHTRFPVTERTNDPQAILGYVNFKDIVAAMHLAPHDPTLRAILRPIPSLLETMPITESLETMLRDRTHIGLVRNQTGAVLGMITLEDILEELIGDIQDEFDRLPAHAQPTGAGWVVGGGISLERFKEVTGVDLGIDLPPAGARHLADWVVGHLGRPARGGDVLQRCGLRILVRKVRRQMVLEAQVTRDKV